MKGNFNFSYRTIFSGLFSEIDIMLKVFWLTYPCGNDKIYFGSHLIAILVKLHLNFLAWTRRSMDTCHTTIKLNTLVRSKCFWESPIYLLTIHMEILKRNFKNLVTKWEPNHILSWPYSRCVSQKKLQFNVNLNGKLCGKYLDYFQKLALYRRSLDWRISMTMGGQPQIFQGGGGVFFKLSRGSPRAKKP